MSKIEDLTPAFPTTEEHGFNSGMPGMTLRQYAAIKLKTPDSGTDWLDAMIVKSLRDEFAAKAMPLAFSRVERSFNIEIGGDWCWDNNDWCSIAINAFRVADAMLEERLIHPAKAPDPTA